MDRPKRRLTAHPEGIGSMLTLTEGSSLRGTIFNFSNTMIGGGILGLPYAVQVYGVFLGTALMAAVGVGSGVTCWMLLYCVDATREGSYAMVGEVLIGRWFGVIVDVMVFLNILGCCTSYMDIIADLVPNFLRFIGAPMFLHDRSNVVYLMTLCVLLPLSSMRSMGALRYVSLVCLGVIAGLVGILVAMGCGYIDVSEPGDVYPAYVGSDLAAMTVQLPVVLFAFNCHMNFPILYRELRKQTFEELRSKFATKRDKMMLATYVSFFIVIVVYCSAASAGYLAFRNRTMTDVLRNLDYRRFWPAEYVKVVYSLAIICSYPVMCYSGCQSIHRLIWHCLALYESRYGMSPDDSASPYEQQTPGQSGMVLNFKRMISTDQEDLGAAVALPSPAYEPLWSPEPTIPLNGTTDYVRLVSEDGDPIVPEIEPETRACPERERVGSDCISPLGLPRHARSHTPAASIGAHQLQVCFLVGLTMLLCIAIPDISTVFGLTGSLSCSALMFAFPGYFFAKVKQLESAAQGRPRLSGAVVAGYVFSSFGVAVGVGSTALILFPQ